MVLDVRLFLLLHVLACLGLVQGHGRLLEPPSRSSMWRLGYDTPKNYNDNQMFCGGFAVQYSPAVGGKCGVCGDPWNGVRENEAGGKYATGQVVRKYEAGQVIKVTVQITANHKGYFEFRLCQKDDPFKKATWDCLNKNLLVDDTTGLTRYAVRYPPVAMDIHYIRLRLPKNVKCKGCVLQWKYNAGNSWGIAKNGTGCVGCGNQEQFYGCADVAIGYPSLELGTYRRPRLCQRDHVGVETMFLNCDGFVGSSSVSQFSRPLMMVSMLLVVISFAF